MRNVHKESEMVKAVQELESGNDEKIITSVTLRRCAELRTISETKGFGKQ